MLMALPSAGPPLLLVADCSLDLGRELGGHLSDAVLLGVLHRALEDVVLGLAANDVGTTGRGIDLGALENLTHDEYSFSRVGSLWWRDVRHLRGKCRPRFPLEQRIGAWGR